MIRERKTLDPRLGKNIIKTLKIPSNEISLDDEIF